MKKLNLLVAGALLFSFSLAEAKSDHNSRASLEKAKKLITAIKEKKKKAKARIQANSILDISSVPKNPEQGQNVVLFSSLSSQISDVETLIEARFDSGSSDVALEHPANNLWIYDAGSFSEIGEHTFTAKIYIRDSNQSQLLKNAIQGLDIEIADLTAQIDQETNEEIRNQLIALRQEKITMKNSLIQELVDLKTLIGTEVHKFKIKGAVNNPGFPSITQVDPSFGPLAGGARILVSGQNFSANPTLLIGGIAATISSATSTEIEAITPTFLTAGFKDIEVRFTENTVIKNAVLDNGYFASAQEASIPVAVAEVVDAEINLGDVATFNSNGSYEPNGQPFSNAWRLISKASGSNLPINGDPVGTNENYSFTPDAPGSYVLELKTITTTNPIETSLPSLAVVNVLAPTNNAPTLSNASLQIGQSATRTVQLSASDADFWQEKSYFIVKQPTLGTATVNSAGLVSYTSGPSIGSDSVEVLVVDSGSPQLSAQASVSISINNNQVPYFGDAGIFLTIVSEGTPVRTWLQSAGGYADDDGQIVDCRYEVDGVVVHGNPDDGCFTEFEFATAGSRSVTLTIEDDLGGIASTTDTLDILNTPMPTGKFTINPTSGSSPLALVADASASTIPGGAYTIENYRWRFFDGSGNLFGATINHTIQNSGEYEMQHREFATIAPNAQIRTDGSTMIYVDDAPPAEGSKPIARIKTPAGREKLVNQSITFDGTDSFDVNVGGSITSYEWILGDLPIEAGSIVSRSYTQARNDSACLKITNANGATSQNCQEFLVVNAGHAPRAIIKANLQGTAPFEFTLDASRSFDTDGTITSYKFWNADSNTVVTGGPSFNYTFENPGEYAIRLTVTDNEGNEYNVYQSVLVDAAKLKKSKKRIKALQRDDRDEPKQSQKQILIGVCLKGNGQACFDLSKIFEQEENSIAADSYRTKACALGIAAACSARK